MTTIHSYGPVWHVPFERNPLFTGREAILAQLSHDLQADSAVALSHPQGISGLGGIGKTQTALEYAYRYRQHYALVYWLQASSPAIMISGYRRLALLLKLPECEDQEPSVVLEAVFCWLRGHRDWLLIYDNIDDLVIASQYLPKAFPGHILFTTRATALGGLAQRVEIPTMDAETGALLLLRRASKLELRDSLTAAQSAEREVACQISQVLDGLPLALDQAGAYIKEMPCALVDYLALYQSRHQEKLLQFRSEKSPDYPASVAATWSLSFDRVRQINPVAAELLNFYAFLAPDPIPEEILTTGLSGLATFADLQSIAYLQAETPFGELLRIPMHSSREAELARHLDPLYQDLLRFSLLQRQASQQTLTIHRLVQAVLRHSIPPEVVHPWMQLAVFCVETCYPSSDEHTVDRSSFDRLLPHALICTTWVEQDSVLENLTAIVLFSKTGQYLDAYGLYKQAEPILQRALALQEQHNGPDHLDTAAILNKLAILYLHRARYEEAEALWQRALAVFQQSLGRHHPEIAHILNNLAILFQAQNRYTEAEVYLQETLTIHRQHSGEHHPATARSLNNLAELYRLMGNYSQAEPLARQARSIALQHSESPRILLASLANTLGLILSSQEKYDDARPLLQEALDIFEGELGPTHPTTAVCLNNLSNVLQRQNYDGEAAQMYERALTISEERLGDIHPNLIPVMNNLAELYSKQGRVPEAEALYRRGLSLCEEQLGEWHFHTALCLHNLGQLLFIQHRYAEAEALYLRALMIWEKILGPGNTHTAYTLNNLASLYFSLGRWQEAQPLMKRALDIWEPEYGADHPEIKSMRMVYALFVQRFASTPPDNQPGSPGHTSP